MRVSSAKPKYSYHNAKLCYYSNIKFLLDIALEMNKTALCAYYILSVKRNMLIYNTIFSYESQGEFLVFLKKAEKGIDNYAKR